MSNFSFSTVCAAVTLSGLLFSVCPAFSADVPTGQPANHTKTFTEVRRFKAKEALQGVAVDARYFYAIDNKAIGKYEKTTGKLIATWQGSAEYPAIHFDGGSVVDGKLYLAHSNYPQSPMTSSVEIFDTATLTPIGSHSFGIKLGSLTWVDRHAGAWWAVFANYSRVFGTSQMAYGNSHWTTLVKMDDKWNVQQSWIFPEGLINRSEPMSISGGSWGPDGRLYVCGHDHPEVYALRFPQMGSVLEVEESMPVDIAGQGIAWDRSKPGTLYGIIRKTGEVTVHQLQ